VSILQKSRTWLHKGKALEATTPVEVSILQKSRTWLHHGLHPEVSGKRCVNPSEIKDLVTQTEDKPAAPPAKRVNPSEIKDLVTHQIKQLRQDWKTVSILQKSRTWLHRRKERVPGLGVRCQSFRNQGPGYTAAAQAAHAPAPCVNPSEIKDLVTPGPRRPR